MDEDVSEFEPPGPGLHSFHVITVDSTQHNGVCSDMSDESLIHICPSNHNPETEMRRVPEISNSQSSNSSAISVQSNRINTRLDSSKSKTLPKSASVSNSKTCSSASTVASSNNSEPVSTSSDIIVRSESTSGSTVSLRNRSKGSLDKSSVSLERKESIGTYRSLKSVRDRPTTSRPSTAHRSSRSGCPDGIERPTTSMSVSKSEHFSRRAISQSMSSSTSSIHSIHSSKSSRSEVSILSTRSSTMSTAASSVRTNISDMSDINSAISGVEDDRWSNRCCVGEDDVNTASDITTPTYSTDNMPQVLKMEVTYSGSREEVRIRQVEDTGGEMRGATHDSSRSETNTRERVNHNYSESENEIPEIQVNMDQDEEIPARPIETRVYDYDPGKHSGRGDEGDEFEFIVPDFIVDDQEQTMSDEVDEVEQYDEYGDGGEDERNYTEEHTQLDLSVLDNDQCEENDEITILVPDDADINSKFIDDKDIDLALLDKLSGNKSTQAHVTFDKDCQHVEKDVSAKPKPQHHMFLGIRNNDDHAKRRVSFSPSTHSNKHKKSMAGGSDTIPRSHSTKAVNLQSIRKSSGPGDTQVRDSIPLIPSNSTSRPDWYTDLNNRQVSMFREVFDMLDRDGGGSLDAQELYSVMKEFEIEVSLEEIEHVLGDLDGDGNGEIDFDEFLYAMSETDRYLDLLSTNPEQAAQVRDARDGGSSRFNPRQTLFFTAIASFAIKNSLGEVERYYASKVRHAPHVISCYTAGARLIGLNDRQLERQLRKMQKAAKNEKSPYAKPLPFVTVDRKKDRKASTASGGNNKAKNTNASKNSFDGDHSKHAAGSTGKKACKKSSMSNVTNKRDKDDNHQKQQCQSQKMDNSMNAFSIVVSAEQVDDDGESYTHIAPEHRGTETQGRRAAVQPDSIRGELLNTLQELAAKGSVVARIPDIHLVPQIRNKLESGDVTEPLCSSLRKRRRTLSKEQESIETNKKTGSKLGKKTHGWVIPRVEWGKSPLPFIKVAPRKGKPFTIEDVADIRKRVSGALDSYYDSLRVSLVQRTREHWSQLHIKEIRSEKLTSMFRTVFRSYSPHKVEEVFPICPWIPGPRFTSRQASKTGVSMLSRSPTCHASKQGDIPTRHVHSAAAGSCKDILSVAPSPLRGISSARPFTTRPTNVSHGAVRNCGFSHRIYKQCVSPQPRAKSARPFTNSSALPRAPSREIQTPTKIY